MFLIVVLDGPVRESVVKSCSPRQERRRGPTVLSSMFNPRSLLWRPLFGASSRVKKTGICVYHSGHFAMIFAAPAFVPFGVASPSSFLHQGLLRLSSEPQCKKGHRLGPAHRQSNKRVRLSIENCHKVRLQVLCQWDLIEAMTKVKLHIVPHSR